MSLLDRHLSFLEALRGAGLPVSLAEDLDAVAALTAVTWEDRALVREAYAATLVKRRSQRADLRHPLRPVVPAPGRAGVRRRGGRRPPRRPRTPRRRRVLGRAGPRRRGGAGVAARAAGRHARRGRGRDRGRGHRRAGRRGDRHLRPAARGRARVRRLVVLRRPPAGRPRAARRAPGPRAAGGRERRGARPAYGRAPHRRLHRGRGGRGAAAYRGGEGGRPRRAHRRTAHHRPARLPLRAALGPRRAAPPGAPAGAPAGHPADPGAPRAAPRPAGLPAYGAGLAVDRRRTPGDPAQAQATAPHRPGGAVRRERVGGQLRAVHAAAGARAARSVPEPARLHLRRPGPRGDPPPAPAGRPRRGDGRPGRQRVARRAVGAHQLWPRVHPVRRGARRCARADGPRC